MSEFSHQPVMPAEVIKFLNPQPGEVILDGTIGLGGHSALIAERLGASGVLFGIDQDENALQIARRKLANFPGRLLLRHGNFCEMSSFLQEESIPEVDGILLDLGVSSLQLD